MSAQYRAEVHKLCSKYARTFGVAPELVEYRRDPDGVVHCPSQPELPKWSMGADDQEWQDGPSQDRVKWARPPKTVIVSRRKR
jgi:hypothetical protein